MTAFERMKLREQAAGSTPREEMIYYAKDMIDTLLPNDPSFKPNTSVIRNGEIIGTIGVRMDNRKLVNEVPTMEIHDVLNSETKFRRGDLLQVETIEDGITKDDYWLCFEENNFHGIQRDGKVELCNYLLIFQDDDDLSIVEEWCVVSRYKTSSTGEDTGKIVTVDNTRRNILIQYNARTAKLKQGKRFFIDMMDLNNPKPYRLTDLDRTSYIYNRVGCFQLVCAEDQLVEDDSPDLGICNYKQSPDIPTPSIGFCEITYSGESIIKCGGSPKDFTALFKDNGENSLTEIEPVWELILPPELQDFNKIQIVSQIGNEIRIQANNRAVIGSKFVLKLSGEDDICGFFEAFAEIAVGDLL